MVDKLIKSCEALNIFSRYDIADNIISLNLDELSENKKEIVFHFNIITETVLSEAFRTSRDYAPWLSACFDLFFFSCDHQQEDIRIVAEECVHKIIKALHHKSLSRIQMELYKVIRRGRGARCIRVAMTSFGNLCHLIRVGKRRLYASNMVQCLKEMIEEGNEVLLDILSTTTPLIFTTLIPHTTDSEATVLLNSLLKKATLEGAVYRRASATILSSIVQSSQNRAVFFATWLLNILSEKLESVDSHQLSWLVCARGLFAGLYASSSQSSSSITNHYGSLKKNFSRKLRSFVDERLLFKLLQSCLKLCSSTNHNIAAACLECLHQLLKTAPDFFLLMLCSKDQEEILENEINSPSKDISFSNNEKNENNNCGSSNNTQNKTPMIFTITESIYRKFLIQDNNEAYNDGTVKISLKVLAVSLLAQLVSIHPSICTSTHTQPISIEHLLYFTKHSDPNLKGSIYLLLSSFICASFSTRAQNPLTFKQLEEHTFLLLGALKHDSSVSVRCALQALRQLLPSLHTSELEGHDLRHLTYNLVHEILKSNIPGYWLVKIELIDLLSEVDYVRLQETEGQHQAGLNYNKYSTLKEWMVAEVVLKGLVDEDQRVRNSACNALLRLTQDNGRMFSHHSRNLHTYSKPSSFSSSSSLPGSLSSFLAPSNLSNMINIITRIVLSSTNKFELLGPCTFLSLLLKEYPVNNYRHCWILHTDLNPINETVNKTDAGDNNKDSMGSGKDDGSVDGDKKKTVVNSAKNDDTPRHSLLPYLTFILTSSPISLDLSIQIHLINIVTELLIGSQGDHKALLHENLFGVLYMHLFRLLTSLSQLVEVEYKGKVVATASTLSPIKRKLKTPKEAKPVPASVPIKPKDESWKGRETTSHNNLLTLLIKKSLLSYMISEDFTDDKVFELLRTILTSVSSLVHLECKRCEMGVVLEEVLFHLNVFFCVEPAHCVVVCNKLLQALFTSAAEPTHEFFRDSSSSSQKQQPIKFEKTKISQNIRLFEDIVVKSLKHFTSTCHNHFQTSLLQLLIFLVSAKVNFSLLDSDQTFLNFIIERIESSETISNREEKERLVTGIFHLLGVLSTELHQGNSVVPLSRLIRLYDSLLASDPGVQLCISCLNNIINILFPTSSKSASNSSSSTPLSSSSTPLSSSSNPLAKPSSSSSSSSKELEAQQEVVICMLLKLSQHSKVLPYLTQVLLHAKHNSDEKWNSISRQIFDHFFPNLIKNQLSIKSLKEVANIGALLLSFSPCIYRSSDALLQLITIHIPFHSAEELLLSLVHTSSYLGLVGGLKDVVLNDHQEAFVHKSHFPQESFHRLFARQLFQFLQEGITCLDSCGDVILRNHVVLKYGSDEVNGKHLLTKEKWTFMSQLLGCLLQQLSCQEDKNLKVAMSNLLTEKYNDGELSKMLMDVAKLSINQESLLIGCIELFISLQQFPLMLTFLKDSKLSGISQKHLQQQLMEKFCLSNDSKNCDAVLEVMLSKNVTFLLQPSNNPLFQSVASLLPQNSSLSQKLFEHICTYLQTAKKIQSTQIHTTLRWFGALHPSLTGEVLAVVVDVILPLCRLSTSRIALTFLLRMIEGQLALAQDDCLMKRVVVQGVKVDKFKYPQLHHMLQLLVQHLRSDEEEDGGKDDDDDDAKKFLNIPHDNLGLIEECIKRNRHTHNITYLMASLTEQQIRDVFSSNSILVLKLLRESLKVYSASKLSFDHDIKMPLMDTKQVYAVLEEVLIQKLEMFCSSEESWLEHPIIDALLTHLQGACHANNPRLSATSSLVSQVVFKYLQCILDASFKEREKLISSIRNTTNNDCHNSHISTIITPTTITTPITILTTIIPHLRDTFIHLATRLIHQTLCLLNTQTNLHWDSSPDDEKDKTYTTLLGMVDEMVKCQDGVFNCLPPSLQVPLKLAIIRLCRHTYFKECLHLSLQLWRVSSQTSPGSIPHEYLMDADILFDYVTRVNLIGWANKQQFEETWMSLLTTLNNVVPHDHESSRRQTISIRCITTLLLSSILHPFPGDPSCSFHLHVPRSQGSFKVPKHFKRTHNKMTFEIMKNIMANNPNANASLFRYSIEDNYEEDVGDSSDFFFHNLEREISCVGFAPCQLSISALKKRMKIDETPEETSKGEDEDANLTIKELSLIDSKLTLQDDTLNEPLDTKPLNEEKLAPADDRLTISTTTSCMDVSMESVTDHSPLAAVAIENTSKKSTTIFGTNTTTDNNNTNTVTTTAPTDPSTHQSTIDVYSCIQFLFELYSSFFTTNKDSQDNLLCFEASRSIVMLSDLLSTTEQVQRLATLTASQVPDDFLAFLVLSFAKSSAILATRKDATLNDQEVATNIEAALVNNHLPSKIFSLFAGLYLLEIPAKSQPQLLINVYVNYLSKTLTFFTPTTIYNQTYVMLMFSVGFTIIQNHYEVIKEGTFALTFIQTCLQRLKAARLPIPIHLAICSGLERLIMANLLDQTSISNISKLAVERLFEKNSQKTLILFRLYLTCFFYDEKLDESQEETESTERHVEVIEKINFIFERMRRCEPQEAVSMGEGVLEVLLMMMERGGSGLEAVNVVVAELLTPHQPHTQIFAGILFKVFKAAKKHKGVKLLLEWVLLSLGSLSQRKPLSSAVWCVSCVFVASALCPRVLALYPLLVERMGCLDEIDWSIFLSGALHFQANMAMLKAQGNRGLVGLLGKMQVPQWVLDRLIEPLLSKTPVVL